MKTRIIHAIVDRLLKSQTARDYLWALGWKAPAKAPGPVVQSGGPASPKPPPPPPPPGEQP